jgi:hypothetical protein
MPNSKTRLAMRGQRPSSRNRGEVFPLLSLSALPTGECREAAASCLNTAHWHYKSRAMRDAGFQEALPCHLYVSRWGEAALLQALHRKTVGCPSYPSWVLSQRKKWENGGIFGLSVQRLAKNISLSDCVCPIPRLTSLTGEPASSGASLPGFRWFGNILFWTKRKGASKGMHEKVLELDVCIGCLAVLEVPV